jgi:hypothetical protein
MKLKENLVDFFPDWNFSDCLDDFLENIICLDCPVDQL